MWNGKNVVLLDGYTYYKKNKSRNLIKWACCMSKYCKAHLKIDNNMIIRERNTEHPHDKKGILKVSSGRYIRL
ncbi:unnamed protein product [Euphydryas editha]|uniref:FLYWCH-type domain-containing protein n=1 Tax=Euphydryas editha TaxID=104508 RepID=A0AAU9TJR7_EUPED|nr:unnamed protein product [Euphydryas editha]